MTPTEALLMFAGAIFVALVFAADCGNATARYQARGTVGGVALTVCIALVVTAVALA